MSIKGKIIKEIEKRPRKAKELKAKLGNDKKVLRALDELVRGNRLICCNGVYTIKSKKTEGLIECTLVKLGKGFGFAQPLDGSHDIFIPGKYLIGAMPGDVLLVSVFKTPRVEGSVEGEVVAITLECNELVGTVELINSRLVIIPDKAPQTPLVIKKSADGGVGAGERAAAVILERANNHDEHRVGISMSFGNALRAKHCAKSILYGAGVEKSFPGRVKQEAKKYDNAIVLADDIIGRSDLRNKQIFTIDSASTKDIDDAIHIEKLDNGYVLGVHIADVSNYVKQGTALDIEAMKRGTSVYFANDVVPMLPRQLSNGICSLNENEDRLAFSCIIKLNLRGEVQDYSFVKSVICSKVKGVYEEINTIFADTASTAIKEKYIDEWQSLKTMRELYEQLAALRKARGSMDIESGESKLILDEGGICVDVKKRERGISECMIEEFMLLANSCAAKLARRLNVPFVYRIHEQPDSGRIDKLKKLLAASAVTYKFESESPSVLELSSLLEKTRGTGLERPIHTGILRAMAKAKYSVQPLGHFGLALSDYAHFTSPIRRYPDLAIHRILSDIVAGGEENEISKRYNSFAVEAARVSSERELAAMMAERDIESCYKAEYIHARLGEVFNAVVSSVAPHGIYVQLENTVEGLVTLQSFTKGEPIVAEGVSVTDKLTGKIWRIGDNVKVKAISADISKGQINFELND